MTEHHELSNSYVPNAFTMSTSKACSIKRYTYRCYVTIVDVLSLSKMSVPNQLLAIERCSSRFDVSP